MLGIQYFCSLSLLQCNFLKITMLMSQKRGMLSNVVLEIIIGKFKIGRCCGWSLVPEESQPTKQMKKKKKKALWLHTNGISFIKKKLCPEI